MQRLVRTIHLKPGELVFEINPLAVFREAGSTGSAQAEQPELQAVIISVPMTLRRRGAEARLVLEGHSLGRKPDDGLVEAVAKAHVMLGMLTDGMGRTIADVANDAGVHVADAAASSRSPSWPQRSPTRSCAAGSQSNSQPAP